MPAYEFVCRDCQKAFEIVHPVTESHPSDLKCPACGSRSVDRFYTHVYAVTSRKS